jgi:hypothetical protein
VLPRVPARSTSLVAARTVISTSGLTTCGSGTSSVAVLALRAKCHSSSSISRSLLHSIRRYTWSAAVRASSTRHYVPRVHVMISSPTPGLSFLHSNRQWNHTMSE